MSLNTSSVIERRIVYFLLFLAVLFAAAFPSAGVQTSLRW